MDSAPLSTPQTDPEGGIAIVTGGTRGIGRGIALALLEAGWQVEICGRSAPERLPEAGGRAAHFTSLDVRDAAAGRSYVEEIAARHGRLDLLVNNAGGSPPSEMATASPRFNDAILALNLGAPIHLSQAAYGPLAAGPRPGAIVNIASVSGLRPSPGTAVYGAAKAGLIGLTKSLAAEWGPRVRVNALVVGLMETGEPGQPYGSDAAQAAIAASLPARRMGRPEDIGQAVRFLASPMAEYISGAVIDISGGGEWPLFLDQVARLS